MTRYLNAHRPPIGAALKARRTALGLSRERLGAAAGGISSATIRRAEMGTVTPNPATITALALALLDAERRGANGLGVPIVGIRGANDAAR